VDRKSNKFLIDNTNRRKETVFGKPGRKPEGGSMSFVLGVLAQVVSFVVFFLVFAYIVCKDEAVIHGIGVFAFYRCFKTRSEQAVEKELTERQHQLHCNFKMRDFHREILADHLASLEAQGFYREMIQADRESLEKRENWLIESQRAMDYAIGVAYLAGFGKIARKFVK